MIMWQLSESVPNKQVFFHIWRTRVVGQGVNSTTVLNYNAVLSRILPLSKHFSFLDIAVFILSLFIRESRVHLACCRFCGQLEAVWRENIQQAFHSFDRLSITFPIWKLNFFPVPKLWTAFKSCPLEWIATVQLYSNFCKCHFCDHGVCVGVVLTDTGKRFSFCVVESSHCLALLEHKGHIHAVEGWAVTEPWLYLRGTFKS